MRVSVEVLSALSAAKIEGNSVVIEQKLERKLYLAVNNVLEAVGGAWNRKAKAHLFEGDAAAALDPVMLTGEVTRAHTKDFGYFPTPPDVVELLFAHALLDPEHIALEPEAGTGEIAIPLQRRVRRVDCIELVEARAAKLREVMPAGTRIKQADFLTVTPEPIYDRIVMNPPFELQADIKHVVHAERFLKPGGRLTAVMSAGIIFRQDRRACGFRAFLNERQGSIESLREGSFRTSGTMVNTVLVNLRAAA